MWEFLKSFFLRERLAIGMIKSCALSRTVKSVFSRLCGVSQYFGALLMMSILPTNVLVSSTHRDDGEFVDAVASVSVEEALVRTVEMAET